MHRRISRVALWALAPILITLSACSGSNRNGTNHAIPTLTLEKHSVGFAAAATDAWPPKAVVNISIVNPSGPVYLRATTTGGSAVYDATVTQKGDSAAQINITPADPATLGVGVFHATVTVIATQDYSGFYPLAGSPKTIDVTYTIGTALNTSFGPEMLTNGDFSAGTTPWQAYTQRDATASISVSSGQLLYAITNWQSQSEDIQLRYAAGFNCVAGKRYRLSFDARMDGMDGWISTIITENGHDLDGDGLSTGTYANRNHYVTGTWNTRTMDFTMPTTNPDAGLQLWLGQSNRVIYFDNFSLKEILN